MLHPNIDIKSKGFNETIIRDNNHNKRSKIDWNAHYDGEEGNILLNVNENNRKKHFDIQFNNDDLVQLLNIPSVNMPLEKRLHNDFLKKRNRSRKNRYMRYEPVAIEILQAPSPEPLYNNFNNNYHSYNKGRDNFMNNSLQKLLQIEPDEIFNSNPNRLTHISSPKINEELILPLTIKPTSQRKKHTPRKYTKRVYKVLRVPKKYKKSRSIRSI